MTQAEKVLRLALQHEKGFLGHLVQAIAPDQMEPGVLKVYKAKKANVAALEARLNSFAQPIV